jgi:RNA polymerase sigma-70 factor (ECF subfamily)
MMMGMERNEILRILMPERTKQVSLAWSILRQAQLSEDAYQDMLQKVLENENLFEGPQHLRDWSWKVLRNRCYEIVRKQKYQLALLDDAVADLVDSKLESRPLDNLPERIDALHECLQGLNENSKRTIKLRYFEGLAGNQIAEQLNRKPGTVYKALQRIYQTLGQCIENKLAASASQGTAE